MYFPNAFKKVFIGKAAAGAIDLRTSGTTVDLAAAQIGLFDAKTYAAISAAPGSGNQTFILAQGSLHTTDKVGPFHGGYKESVKSKVINPKYVSRFFKVAAQAPQNQVIEVSVKATLEDTTQRLRLDLKGSPALRLLSHNAYKTLAAYTGCAADPAAPALVDPTTVAIKWAQEIAGSPYIAPFISVVVKDTTGATVTNLDAFTAAGGITSASTAKLVITAAYEDTKFGNATFSVTDHYELEPLKIYASGVDESGEPCATQNITSAETQAPRQASGVGETVLRDLILSNRYLQEPFSDGGSVNSLRLREILDDVNLGAVSRTAQFDQICILHNVPRFNNPSSTFDNDQYLLVVNVPTGTDTTALTNLIGDMLDLAGNGVALETF
jgi:hypothetical protein